MPLTPGARPSAARASQGEALGVWALWTILLVAIVVTYSRLDPLELYNVSGEGLTGGLSRALVELNFPISLVAIALVLVALDDLPVSAWSVAGPAIALCAVTAWPGVVNEDDLDARPVNVVPALGVLLALGLTVAAARRSGWLPAPRRTLDPLRLGLATLVVLVSVPWLAADLGLFLPEGVFVMERPVLEDGSTLAAVHLGHHHGLDGALLVVSALLLSRRLVGRGRLAIVTTAYVSLAFAYGAVNLAEDLWHEQLVKRGWVDTRVPSALEPGPRPVWLVILAVTALTALALRWERNRVATGRAAVPPSPEVA